MPRWGGRLLVPALLVVGVAAAALVGGRVTSATGFCSSCHEMNYTAVPSWRTGPHGDHSGKAVAECKNCHIRPGVSGWVAAKANGLREVYIHLRDAPSEAQWQEELLYRSREVRSSIPDYSCTGCHDPTAMRPLTAAGTRAHDESIGRARCLDCHATVGHGPR